MSDGLKSPAPDWLSHVVIRNLGQTDLPALEWDGEYTHFRRLYREIYESTRRGKALMWIAILPSVGVIGQVFVQLSSSRLELADGKERAYIYGFRIKPGYRGYGLGRHMLNFTETDLIRRNFRIATLNVSQDNSQARNLYEQNGYRIVGDDPGRWSYHDDQGVLHRVNEPAWRMEKLLTPSGRR